MDPEPFRISDKVVCLKFDNVNGKANDFVSSLLTSGQTGLISVSRTSEGTTALCPESAVPESLRPLIKEHFVCVVPEKAPLPQLLAQLVNLNVPLLVLHSNKLLVPESSLADVIALRTVLSGGAPAQSPALWKSSTEPMPAQNIPTIPTVTPSLARSMTEPVARERKTVKYGAEPPATVAPPVGASSAVGGKVRYGIEPPSAVTAPGSAETGKPATLDLTGAPCWKPNFDRAKAEMALDGQPAGTYLLRPGKNSKYVLSFVALKCNHAEVFERNGRLSLISDASKGAPEFSSLDELLSTVIRTPEPRPLVS